MARAADGHEVVEIEVGPPAGAREAVVDVQAGAAACPAVLLSLLQPTSEDPGAQGEPSRDRLPAWLDLRENSKRRP